ncbi:MAG: MBL fold metallo-hydrolase [Deltaproteobacteria bacterium]|nr:MBL fold metallo-hydrolase [Deltaproteobacteria bacterium]
MTDVIRLRLGTSNAYLIGGKNRRILVDAGNARKEKKFLRIMNQHDAAPSEIGLIIITHVHYDHVGSLKAIRALCHCPVAVHADEKGILDSGSGVLPKGVTKTGKWLIGLGRRLLRFYPELFDFAAVDAEIALKEELDLTEFGIPGRIIFTPGHTTGSVSVVLRDGKAFIGDLAINYLPFGGGPIFPPFADNAAELLQSWENLLAQNIISIFPGHGKPFSAKQLRRVWLRKMRQVVNTGT